MGIRILRARACAGVALGAAAALACTGMGATAATAAEKPAPLLRAATDSVVTDGYIVVLKKGTSAKAANAAVKRAGVKAGKRFTHAVSGYSATLTAAQLKKVRQDPAVAYVEPDAIIPREALDAGAARDTIENPGKAWGLDRSDQRKLPLDKSYAYDGKQIGAGVKAYVIDDGVRQTHADFRNSAGASRVAEGHNATTDGQGMSSCPTADPEIWGHGTHVAGILAGRTHGVAKAVTVVPVKVFSCPSPGNPFPEDPLSVLIDGIDWVVQDHAAGAPAVANLSLGLPVQAGSNVVDEAINRLVGDGVTTVVSAGNQRTANDPRNACASTPARVPNAITVAATGSDDGRPSWSYFGSCVDVFAPGVSIQSAGFLSDGAYVYKSGTSMSSPFVAGVVATWLGAHPSATPAQARAAIVNGSTGGVVKNAGTGSPNRLLYAPLADAPAANTAANVLTSGKALRKGASIKSPNGIFTLTQQANGKLALLKPGNRVLWQTKATGTWTQLETNGNLALFDLGKRVWRTDTTSGAAELRLQNDGNLVLYRLSDNRATWASRTAQKVAPPQPAAAKTDTLPAGQAIYRGGKVLTSTNGRFVAGISTANGALVVTRVGGRAHFQTSALDDDWLSVQGDGNAVLYRSNGAALWSTGRGSGSGAIRMVMQNDGNLVLYRGSKATWSSGIPR